jgi:NADPH-dependent F420 reductase
VATIRLGILGGTGPAGRALAARLAAAGAQVLLGSRSLERAAEAVEGLLGRWPALGEGGGELVACTNAGAAKADMVVVATPWEGAASTVAALAADLAGKVVVSMVNAVAMAGGELQPLVPSRGSMAAAIQAAAPAALVSAAFHHLPARELGRIDTPMDADVLVCSDHPEAAARTAEVARLVPGLRPLEAGSLSLAGAVESMTAVVLNLNNRYKARAYLRMAGLDEVP